MYYSIDFFTEQPSENSKRRFNTWETWGLIPTSRPFFQTPSKKITTVDIPGMNGVLDLSESLTGYPLFNNREGSIEFVLGREYGRPNDDGEFYTNFQGWYHSIVGALHGKYLYAILEEEIEFLTSGKRYYEGLFSINDFDCKNDGTGTYLTMDYSLKPYTISTKNIKLSYTNTESSIYLYKNIELTGNMPISPMININTQNVYQTMDIIFIKGEDEVIKEILNIPNNTFISYPDLILLPWDDIKIGMKRAGTITLTFKDGRL